MVITRSPLRISLGGGGTDFPSYYKENEGFLLAAAIDKYVFVTINTPFKNGIFLKYSSIENVMNIKDIHHPIIRESLNLYLNDNTSPKIEITSVADIPSGTGLGSSGSFTTALLKCLSFYEHKNIDATLLAEMACDIEINKLKEPIGKQDQYISAVGGITSFTFCKDDSVIINPLKISANTLFDLEDNLLLFFTGYSRSASLILKDQQIRSQYNDADMIANLHFVKEIGYMSKKLLEEERTSDFGALLTEQWEHKKKGLKA